MNRFIPPPHLVRYGTAADQHFLLGDFLDTYGGLIINANMVAHIPSAITSFLTQRTKNKPFFIDPQTHAFQHDLSHLQSQSKEGKLKRSIQRLLEKYGDPVKNSIQQERPVRPEDFKDDKKLRSFCERVIEFQCDTVSDQIEKGETEKYYAFLKEKQILKNKPCRPSLVIAPYFYLTPNTFSRWLPVNRSCAEASQSIAKKCDLPLGVQIVLSRDILTDKDLQAKVAASYSSINADVFLIWVDMLDEQEASIATLKAFVLFLQTLSEKAIPIINLFGGYFSILLMKSGKIDQLKGVTHSLEYGEDRGVVPVGGGIPTAKYYFPALHTRISFGSARRAVKAYDGMKSVEKFHKNICDCNECRKVVKTDPEKDFYNYGETKPVSFVRQNKPMTLEFPLPETREHSVSHYMWQKDKEFKSKITIPDACRELMDAKRKLERQIGLEDVAHCEVWHNILTKL